MKTKIVKLQFANEKRPKKIIDIIGQQHLIGLNAPIYKMIQNKLLVSMIFYGPSGVGKSSLAQVLCNEFNVNFAIFNCAYDNKKKLQDLLKINQLNENFVLILEEIHRLNIDKQDFLLDVIENKDLIIFATTTENPYFVINPSIRSRCTIFHLKNIKTNDLIAYTKKLIVNKEIGTLLSENQIQKIVNHVNGDLRVLLNLLNKIHVLYPETIDEDNLHLLLDTSYFQINYDNDIWHDLKSAYQKSIRGSDPDAALYYLARLLLSGDLKTICRRTIICAYEDIGLANMDLCNRVNQAMKIVLEVGLPECLNILGPIVIEMALSPKSSSGANGMHNAWKFVQNNIEHEIPKHITSDGTKKLKEGNNYIYPHDFAFSYVKQDYLPKELTNTKFYLFNKFSKPEINYIKYWLQVNLYLKGQNLKEKKDASKNIPKRTIKKLKN